MSAAPDTGSEKEFERYLHENIPLSAAMGVQVRLASRERVEFAAPLRPNINHRDTLFGGSAAAIAVLCAWSLITVRMRESGMNGRLVIQRNTMSYDEPVAGDFTAVATFDDDRAWDRFKRMFERYGKARISLGSRILYRDRAAAVFEGEFVALSVP
ncbi:MAG TPA: YiiD C-terminal domain-containing protein [Steroidobacteraceae bacterium]